MTTTTTNAAVSLKAARAAVREAYRQLCNAAHQLDMAGCDAGADADEVYATRDSACELRDMVCDLADEVGAHAEKAGGE